MSKCCPDVVGLKVDWDAFFQRDKLYLTINGQTEIVDLSSLRTVIEAELDQIITFGSLPNKFENDPDFPLNAVASSGLPISYTSSNTDVAVVTGTIVQIVGSGITDITAFQSGSDQYKAAVPVVRTLTVVEVGATFTAFWGWKSDATTPNVNSLQKSGTFNSGEMITVDVTDNTVPQYFFIAEPINEPQKTKWSSESRNGNIGAFPELFKSVTANGYRFYISNYRTDFTTKIDFK